MTQLEREIRDNLTRLAYIEAELHQKRAELHTQLHRVVAASQRTKEIGV